MILFLHIIFYILLIAGGLALAAFLGMLIVGAIECWLYANQDRLF